MYALGCNNHNSHDCDNYIFLTGVCVGIERRCDRRKDCADGSDENDCTMVLRSNNVPKIKTNNGSNEIAQVEKVPQNLFLKAWHTFDFVFYGSIFAEPKNMHSLADLNNGHFEFLSFFYDIFSTQR